MENFWSNEWELEWGNFNIHKNKKGQFHRKYGPAIVWENGGIIITEWWINGQRHREDGPAITWSDGRVRYYLNNKLYMKGDYDTEIVKIKLERLKELQ